MKAYLILFLATLILSQAGNVIRFAQTHPISVAFYRLLFASIIILPFALKTLTTKQLMLLKENKIKLILMGVFFCLHFFFWIRAIQLTKVAIAATCFALNPVFITIGAAVFLKEKIKKETVLCIILGFLGIAIIGLNDFSPQDLANHFFVGDLLSVLAAVSFAIYFLIGKTLRHKIDNFLVMSSVYLVGVVFSFSFILFSDLPLFGFSSQTWLALLVLAIFQTILGHASVIYVLKFFNASFVSAALLLEPVLAAIVAFYLFEEKMNFATALGYFLITSGMILLFYEDIKSTLFKKKSSP